MSERYAVLDNCCKEEHFLAYHPRQDHTVLRQLKQGEYINSITPYHLYRHIVFEKSGSLMSIFANSERNEHPAVSESPTKRSTIVHQPENLVAVFVEQTRYPSKLCPLSPAPTS